MLCDHQILQGATLNFLRHGVPRKPDTCRAQVIGKVFEHEQARAAAFAEALDGLTASVPLVDPTAARPRA